LPNPFLKGFPSTSLSTSIEQKQETWLSCLLGSQTFWVFIAVIVASLALSFATDSFATSKNLYNITRNVTFVAIIALGMTLVIITGGIDLSVGSVLCLCSMVLAVVMNAGYSIEVGIAASVATALVVGAFNGFLIAYIGLPPFVVTLGMLSVARSLAMVASGNTWCSSLALTTICCWHWVAERGFSASPIRSCT
jgi:ribose transport system permease protein